MAGWLHNAVMRLALLDPESTHDRAFFQQHLAIPLWARPHEGPGNPHTRVALPEFVEGTDGDG